MALHFVNCTLLTVSGIPKSSKSLVITGGENAIMELVVADILDLTLMVVQVQKWGDRIVLLFFVAIPDGKATIIAPSRNVPIFV